MTENAPNIEDALVGSLILCPEEYAVVAAIVKPDDFEREAARLVYEAIRFLVSEGTPVDVVLLRDELKRQGNLEAAGGVKGLASFPDAATSGAQAKHYAERVSLAARDRRIREAVNKAYLALESGGKVNEVFGELRADLKEAEASDVTRLKAKPIFDAIMEQLDPENRRDLISTGYRYLDMCHGGGVARGSLTIIGAAPSMGKTQFVINLVFSMESMGKTANVLYVSMEMGELEMSQRLVAMAGGLNINTTKQFFQLTAKKSTLEEYGERFERGCKATKALPMRMVSGSFTPEELRAIASRYSGRFDVMIVDYVQRCKGEKGQQIRDRVEEATRTCKDIAMEHNAAVIAIASLNRDGYRDNAAKPDMQHLRESGNIEFDADNIWMLWREKDTSVSVEDMELYIRKQRNGPLSVVMYDFELPTGSIREKPFSNQKTNY